MSSFWVHSEIVALKRTPAETLLLARICYRAGIAKDGRCRDTNKELATAINIHPQSVSDLIKKFDKDQIVTNKVSQEDGNKRELIPISKILIPYKEKADSYKAKTDGPTYKDIPYTTSKDSTDTYESNPDSLSANDLDPMSETLRPSKQNTQTHYKEYKTSKTFKNSLLKKVREILTIRRKRKLKKAPPVPAAPPAKDDPFFNLKGKSENCNVPFSTWYTAYKYIGGEPACRRIWLTLTDEERTNALTHTLDYVVKTPNKQFRKFPTNYLDDRFWNNEIIDRRAKTDTKPKRDGSGRSGSTGQREVIRTTYTKQKFKRSGGNTNASGAGSADAA